MSTTKTKRQTRKRSPVGSSEMVMPLNDFEKWYEKEGIKRVRGYDDGEMVAICGIMRLAWLEATNRALKAKPKRTARFCAAQCSARTLANRIAVHLFRDDSGQKAERLVLEFPGGHNGGGWCERAVVDLIEAILEAEQYIRPPIKGNVT